MADENTGVKISLLPAASNLADADVLAGVQSETTKKFSLATLLAWIVDHILPSDIGAVPATREINGQSLTDDITLDAADVGARPDDWMPSAADVGAQPEIDVSGILKGDGNGGVSAAIAGTDYATPSMLEPETITSYTLVNATPSIAAIQTAYTTCYQIGKMLFFFLSFQAGANAIAPGTTFADLTVDSNSFAMISGVTGDCAITGTRLSATRVVLKLIGSSSVAAYDTFGCSMMLLLN